MLSNSLTHRQMSRTSQLAFLHSSSHGSKGIDLQSRDDQAADKTHSARSSSLQMRLTSTKVVLRFDCFMNGKNLKKAMRVGVRDLRWGRCEECTRSWSGNIINPTLYKTSHEIIRWIARSRWFNLISFLRTANEMLWIITSRNLFIWCWCVAAECWSLTFHLH